MYLIFYCYDDGKSFVHIPVKLFSVFSYEILVKPQTQDFYTLWYAIERFFLQHVPNFCQEKKKEDFSLQSLFYGALIGIPIIHNFYLKALLISIPSSSVTSSEPNIETSMVACLLLYQ